MDIVATAHLPVNRDQLREIDDYMQEFEIKTRSELLDEAVGEFMAKRKRKYVRRYARSTGLKQPSDTPRRRATDL